MPRFPPTRFPPGFFDLPADAGEELPLAIIARWTSGPGTEAAAHELLAPHTVRGIVVSSDTAGLTRLSGERSLIELMAMISRPKELVHALGRAIGGRAIGVWAADNTQMFYPTGVAPERVLGMLLTLRDRVRAECEVGIGLAAHVGTFYELGSGLFGPEADLVESVAEDHTEAHEVVVTGALLERLPDPSAFQHVPRADLLERYGPVSRITDGPRLAGLDDSDAHYPLPFSDEFYTGLQAYHRTRRTSIVPRPAYQDLTIVVVDREREDPDQPEVAALNDLALAAAVARLGRASLEGREGLKVKTTAQVSIYAFQRASDAVPFARALRDGLATERVEARIGIATGRTLLFDLGRGLMDLAGPSVNLAAKLAQDAGGFGAIRVMEASARAAGLGGLAAERVVISGVAIDMVVL